MTKELPAGYLALRPQYIAALRAVNYNHEEAAVVVDLAFAALRDTHNSVFAKADLGTNDKIALQTFNLACQLVQMWARDQIELTHEFLRNSATIHTFPITSPKETEQ